MPDPGLLALAASEARLRAMLECALDCVIGIDADGQLIEFNPAAEAVFGWRREEILGRPMADVIIPERLRGAHHNGMARFLRTRQPHVLNRRVEVTALRRDGSEFPAELSITAFRERGHDFFTAYMRDITERKHIENELRIAAIAFESQEGMFITDANGRIQRVNHAFTAATGYSALEAIGQTPSLLRSGRHDESFYRDIWERLKQDGYWQGEIWNRRKNGEIYPEWLTITAVKDDTGRITHHVAAFSDITQRKAAEEEIRHLAFYDPLTRLPNRRLLLDRLAQALAAASREGQYGALLFIDLDNFKALNDTLGHAMGDRLLQLVAARVQGSVRAGDTVARLGGDEFVVMLGGLGEHAGDAAAQAEAVGEKILATLNLEYQLGDHPYRNTPSIGIALYNSAETGCEELLRRADMAMYEAKAAGRNTVRFFDPDMQASVQARLDLESDLRAALREDQFELAWQPQVNGAGDTIGHEALLRWNHPRRGMLLPAEFMTLAEESGLARAIDLWVLRTVCRRLASAQEMAARAAPMLAVNISPGHFRHPDCVNEVIAILDETGAPADRLQLELTEDLLLEEVDETVRKMEILKAVGVRFALDNLGTGCSSLAWLKRLRFDQIKIHRSFVRNITADANDAAIARVIVALGASLDIPVIASGVETEAQRDFLAIHHCHAFQGYLFGHPVATP